MELFNPVRNRPIAVGELATSPVFNMLQKKQDLVTGYVKTNPLTVLQNVPNGASPREHPFKGVLSTHNTNNTGPFMVVPLLSLYMGELTSDTPEGLELLLEPLGSAGDCSSVLPYRLNYKRFYDPAGTTLSHRHTSFTEGHLVRHLLNHFYFSFY